MLARVYLTSDDRTDGDIALQKLEGEGSIGVIVICTDLAEVAEGWKVAALLSVCQ